MDAEPNFFREAIGETTIRAKRIVAESKDARLVESADMFLRGIFLLASESEADRMEASLVLGMLIRSLEIADEAGQSAESLISRWLGRIEPANKTKPLTKELAAIYKGCPHGHSNKQQWIDRHIAKGMKCEPSGGNFVFDRDDFPRAAWPLILTKESLAAIQPVPSLTVSNSL